MTNRTNWELADVPGVLEHLTEQFNGRFEDLALELTRAVAVYLPEDPRLRALRERVVERQLEVQRAKALIRELRAAYEDVERPQ